MSVSVVEVQASSGVQVVNVNVQGPQGPGAQVLAGNIAASLNTGATQALYTATQRTVVTGVVIRVDAAPTGSTATVPRARLRSSAGVDFNVATSLLGLTSPGMGRVLLFGGNVPVLEAGDILQLILDTPSGATAFAVRADILGYKVAT